MTLDRLSEFITLWVVIDPIGSLPIFLRVAAARPTKDDHTIALYAVLTAFAVLLFFIVLGQLLLQAIDVPLTAFQIAGGIVLFLFALDMIFGEPKADDAVAKKLPKEAAIFPLAVPSIASPGAMLAVVLLTDDARHNIVDQTWTVGVVAVVLFLQFLLLLSAQTIESKIGEAATSLISRVMGTILGAVAVTEVLDGISTWLKIPLP